VPAGYYLAAIVVSEIVFGLGHLPTAFHLFPATGLMVVAYVIIGNALFGFVAGYLYWKRGLESAIVAHMLAHVVMSGAECLSEYYGS
jgi:membrane protease YdiL (CAAX protease family)